MKTTNTRCFLLTVILLNLLCPNARAFECGLLWGQDEVHQGITKAAVASLKGYYLPKHNIELDEDMWPRALEDINAMNKVVDWDRQFYPKYHFDNESFFDASSYLTNQKEQVITLMLKGSYEAKYELGSALHCLQDFYCHANFIELGRGGGQHGEGGDIDHDLGWNVITSPPSGDANHNVTCESTFHQICYCFWCGRHHLCNKAIKWWNYTHYSLGNAGLTTLTTGWSWNLYPAKTPGGKIWHGGLNKDNDGRPFFWWARQSAVNATADYIQQILDAVDQRSGSDAVLRRALETLGFEGRALPLSMDFVCDNSTDMGSQFADIKTIVHGLVTSHLNQTDEPSSYLLELFDFDSNAVLPPYKTADAEDFLGFVDSSTTKSGTGLCPKPVIQALQSAVNSSEKHANLYCFSGSRFSNPSPLVMNARIAGLLCAALKKGISIDEFVFYSCGSVDPFFYLITSKLGGQVFVLNNNPIPKVTSLVNSEIAGDIVPLLSVSGTLATNTVKEFTVLVDSTVSSVTFLVSMETGGIISFITPAGASLTPGQPGISIWELGEGRAATVSLPQAGNWRVQVQGVGQYSVSAKATTPIQLGRFGFVEAPTPDCLPFFPIPGQPTQVTNVANAFLSGPYAAITNLSWRLITPSGDSIQSFAMDPEPMLDMPSSGLAGVVCTGTVALPYQPFKVAVTGSDTNGYAFQRILPATYQMQSVEVRSLQPRLDVVTPGVSYHVRYVVSNLGSPGVFNVDVSAGRAVLDNLGPETLTLGTGETNIVEADVLLPTGSSNADLEYVNVGVSRSDDPTIFNGTADELIVGPDYAGDTTINSSAAAATLTLSRPEMITNGPAGGNLVLIGGTALATLDLNGNFETINGLVSQGVEAVTRVTSGPAATLTVGDNDASGTFGGKIVNAVALVKIGNGIQTLAGTNTYSGSTKVVSGTLALKNFGSISNTPLILVLSNATFDVSQAIGGWKLNAGQVLTGGGVVTGSVTAASGSWIEAGSGGSTVAEGYDGGTPTFANDLTLNGDVTNVFILYSFPANALITVAGDLTLNGVSPVLIGHETLPAGRYPLIAYGGTLTGSASANLELGCFDEDSRQTAVLDDSIPGEIDLVVTGSAGNLTWVGDGVSNNWDMTTTNWLNGASPERFFPGDSVVFDDSGSSNPAVNLTDSLAPSSILVDAAGNYTFAGTGDLSATTLIKTNTGTLVLANSGTNAILQLIIEGGTVQVNNWLTGGGGVTVAGGTLGGTGTITGPVTVQAEGCLDADGVLIWELSDGRNLTVSNTLLLTGTTVMGINKAANTNNQVRGITTLTYGGTLVVTNVAGTLATGDSFKLFDATNYTGSFAAISPSTPGVGLAWDMVGLTVNGTLAVVSAAGDKYKANNTTALNQQASWTNHVVPGSTNYGIWTATVTAPNTTNSLGADMTWGGIKIINPGGPVLAASGNTLTLNGVSGTGIDMVGASQDLTLDCGVTLAAGQTWTVATNRMLAVSGTVGGSGSLTKSGFGTLTLSGYNAFSGDVTINQGQLWIKNSYALGTGSKMVTCNNGTLGHCQLHLDGTGGNLTLPSGINFLVSNWADPGTVYNEGGDNAINGNFTITSGGGGLIFLANAGSLTLDGTISANTSGRGVVFDGPADSVANGIISDGTGGSMLLLKTGAGTTTLNAANTYSGTTEVRTGTLAVNGSLATASVVTVKTNATLGGTGLIRGPVTVQAGATLSPGIWELGLGRTEIISNTVSLAGTTVLGLNKAAGTNDQVRGITTLTYGGTLLVTNVAGTLAVGDSFKLFDAANYVGSFAAISPASPGIGIGWLWSPTNGTLSVVQAVATNPTNITWTANSTQLNLAWPADHIGWQLQVQTNNIGVGLSTNWLPVPGSVSTDQMTIPVNRSNGSVFYRLKY